MNRRSKAAHTCPVPAAVSIVLPTPPMPWLEIRDLGAVTAVDRAPSRASSALSSCSWACNRALKLGGSYMYTQNSKNDRVDITTDPMAHLRHFWRQ